MRILSTLILLFVLATMLGCGESVAKTPMELKDVPADIQKIAKEQLPDVNFERAMRKKNGEYELIGKTKTGKVREIEISPEGKVMDIE